jgi:RHS repeat-associated protein
MDGYDTVGHLKTMTDFNGHIVTYLYDEQNRLTEKQFADGSKVQYGYLRNGLQDTVTFRNSAGLVTSFYDYDYDVRDRLTKRTDSIDGVARSINYGYDIASNRTSVTTASGTTTYSYDDRNRLDVTRFNGAIVADYDYDAASRLTKTTFGNGTEETRVYDTLNRLKELTSQRGTTVLSKYLYTLDKVGNRKTATETVNGQNRSLAYTYDDLYRLTDEVITDGVNGDRTANYTYDFVGNRQTKTINGVTTTYAYDGNDRLRTEKVGSNVTATYDYDNNGSTTQKVENGVTTTYVWNDEKRLVSATVGTTQVEYVYNDQGIRVASKQNGVETRYLLDEGIVANVWEEYAPNGTVQASYVYGYDLITQTQAGQTSYYLVDGLGSTRLLTDTQGQVLNAYGYEAFGETVSQSGPASNKYQYAGEQFDAAIGDYYLRQRFYDTSSGRFGRMDAYEGRIGSPSSLQKYLYAHSNPIQFIDPTGYFSISNVLTTMAILGILLGAFLDQTAPALPGLGQGISTQDGLEIENNTISLAHNLASSDRNGSAYATAELMQYAAGSINPKQWLMNQKTRSDYLKILSDVLTGDGYNWHPFLNNSPRTTRPTWLQKHEDDENDWKIWITPDAEDKFNGITGRRDHFVANANYGTISYGYELYQVATGQESSKNDRIMNSLGRTFGIGLVIRQFIPQHGIRGWFNSEMFPD